MTHLDPSRGPRVSPGGTRYYHVGYAIKMHWKKLIIFQIVAKSPFMLQNSKYWPFLVSSDSCLFEFVVNEDKIGDFGCLWAIFEKLQKIWSIFLRISLLDHLKIIRPHEFWQIQIGQTLPISKLTNFLKFDAYMAILWPKENWTVFSCIFMV